MNLEFRRALSERERNWRTLPNSTGATLSRICYSLVEVVALLRRSAWSEEPHSWFTCFRTIVIKLFIISAYAITNKTLILWLSYDLGFSDQAAGALVGWVWAPAMTICTLLAGSLTDALGLRRTFFLGVTICLIARAVMVFG